jgi:hypothetical protein
MKQSKGAHKAKNKSTFDEGTRTTWPLDCWMPWVDGTLFSTTRLF